MEQVLISGFQANLNATTTKYDCICGGRGWWSPEGDQRQLISTAGIIKNLRVKLVNAPGVGKSYDFTLIIDGAPTALTVHIQDNDTSGIDTTREVNVVAGHFVSMECVPTGTPAIGYGYFSCIFEGSTENESLILRSSGWVAVDLIEYFSPMGVGSISTDESRHRQVIPTSGKLKNLYIDLSESPGVDTDAYKFTLRVNGIDSALTCTVTAPDTEGSDTEHEVAVSAGDYITIQDEPLNAPANNPIVIPGMTFLADTDGESILLGGSGNDLNDGVTEYNSLINGYSTWTATEDNHYQLGQSCTLKKLYMLLSAAPGSGKSYTFTLRKPGNGQADGNLTVTIADAATTGNDTGNEDSIADDDYVDLKCVPAGTPDVVDAYWGVVGYIEVGGINYPISLSPGLTASATIVKGWGRSIALSPGLTVAITILKGWGRKITTSSGLTVSVAIAKSFSGIAVATRGWMSK